MARPGYELPFLLAAAFRTVVDDLHAQLAVEGHPDARPLHGFALQAIGSDGASVSELGRRLGTSKQAAAKTVAALERLGYARTEPDPSDSRARRVRRTRRGEALLAHSARGFARIRAELAGTIGEARLAAFEDDLARIVQGRATARLADLPGWIASGG